MSTMTLPWGAAEDSMASSDDKDYYVDLQDLRAGVEFPDYAMCLPRYARMDGSYPNAPDNLDDMGYVSDSISGADGVFAVPPAITFSFTQNHSSVGITLKFNDYSGDYCSKVNIRWYRDDTLLADRIYHRMLAAISAMESWIITTRWSSPSRRPASHTETYS